MGISACLNLDGFTGGAPIADAGAQTEGGALADANADVTTSDTSDAAGIPDAGENAIGDAAQCGAGGPADGLLAYYPFDETGGDTSADCSGHALAGTFVHAAPADGSHVAGHVGGAIHVSAAAKTGCVDIGTGTSLQTLPFSVAAWVRVTTYPDTAGSGTTAYVVGQSANAGYGGWRLGMIGGSGGAGDVGFLQGESDGASMQDEQAWPGAGTWHHVTATVEASKLALFIDGKAAGVPTTTPFPLSFSAVSMRIGCRADDGNYFDGDIDDLRIYGRVLTASEIAALAAL